MNMPFWTRAALLLAPLWLTACASPRTSLDIAVAPDGVVSLENERVAMRQLPKKLKSAGANRQTAVYVTVPEHASPELMREITETLATAGYARVVFTKPRRVEAGTADDR